jgi:hypothetical protein
MKTYSFDINKMIRWLMPYFLVKPTHYAWLQTLLVRVKNQYADFLIYRDQQLANATIDSSVNRLTQALWDTYDSTQSIYILHPGDYRDENFIYLEMEGETPGYDYLESDGHTPFDYDYLVAEYGSGHDFIVMIPVILAGSTELIRAFVKRYVFFGISFTIKTF